MKTAYVFLLVLIFLFSPRSLSVTPDEVLEKWSKNYAPLDSVEFVCTEKYVEVFSSIDPNLARKLPRYVTESRIQQGGKYKSTKTIYPNNENEPSIEEASFDGIEQRIYRNIGKIGEINQGQEQYRSNYEKSIIENYLLMGDKKHESPLVRMLKKPARDPNYYLIECGQSVVNGVNCHGFKLFRSGKDSPVSELWVSVDKGMLPVKHLKFNAIGNLSEYTETLEAAESNGLWYPQKARKGVKGLMKKITIELIMEKFIHNPSIDPNIFRLEFPIGTKVIDWRIKESYKVGID